MTMSGASSYITAFGSSAIVTSVELTLRTQRHPFNDRRSKAVGWWAAIVGIDTLIGFVILFGLVKSSVIAPNLPDGTSGWLSGIVIGVLGPLALRSPVRKSKFRDTEVAVGITYIYDAVRVFSLYALDERMVRLKRKDVSQIREFWKAARLNPFDLVEELRAHLGEHERMEDDTKQRIGNELTNLLTIPGEDQQFDMLIKLMRRERLKAMMDDFSARSSPGGSKTESRSISEMPPRGHP